MNELKTFETYESMTDFIGQNLIDVKAIDYNDKTVVIWRFD
jgi:hypothetical protein